ncbi:alpha/beta hydrolase [Cecembia sp.]|uniref:alpha/beta hydrolase n=1 Tax=Cecembia sp. TaxID=1898110 RepID=UPI0025C3A02C|nr:alpha/beta hydrolase [Cecembia sp.]
MKHFETEYITHDKYKLYLQAWLPEQPVASLLLVHGLAEHSGRYAHLAKKLVEAGVAVFSFDGRGHGKSAKTYPTAYFGNYQDYLKDIDALFQKVKAYYPGIPNFIFGHSMGGGMVAAYALHHGPDADGILLSAPALQPSDDISKFLIGVSGLLSKIAPKLKVLKLDSSKISRDLKEVEKYDTDPLVYHGPVPARTGHELLRMMQGIKEKVATFQYPVLLLHGTEDQLTDPKGTEFFFRNIASEDKTFHRYPGLFHELINEPEKETVMNDILHWLQEKY